MILAGLGVVTALSALTAGDAKASWPPPSGATSAQLEDPKNWPNDPSYGPSTGGKPDYNGQGGTWQYWSWLPGVTSPSLRKPETATGMSLDVAWTYTIGDPRVKISVLDSGVEWDDVELIHKAALNAKELANAKPLDAMGMPCGGTGDLAGFDCNGDGAFDLYDYEVSKHTSAGKDLIDANGNGVLDPGDLIQLYSDGKDDDGNGFVDDICGWDFFKDDNDPYDDTRYGHGTGEANDSTGEANNGIGGLGGCPKCHFIPLRVGDSFIVDSNDFGQAVVYAVDNGVSVIQEALGAVNQSNLSRAAIEYAYGKGVAVIASAADENSRHHNMPGTASHTIPVHAIEKDGESPQSSSTFLAYHPCSNYGGQIILSASGTGCASEATGRSSGIAGLIYSMGLQRSTPYNLTGEEVRQLMIAAADLINVPESWDPTDPNYDPSRYYPSKATFSQRFGYGRQNAGKAVKMVADGAIPPEVDVSQPDLFAVIDPSRTTMDVPIYGHISAKRMPASGTYEATVEWAPGVDPDEGTYTTLATIPMQPQSSSYGADGTPLAYFKASELPEIDNIKSGLTTEKENQYTITLRIRAVAHYGGSIGDVKGETRRPLYIHKDATMAAGFPKYLGASGEMSPRLVDLDGDGKREIVYPDADGYLHAWRADGTELAGWPYRTQKLDGFKDTEASPFVAHYLTGNNGWTRSEVKKIVRNPGDDKLASIDIAHEAISPSAPAIGDVDGDGKPEIVFGSWAGTVYAVHVDGTDVKGWPKRLPDVPSCPRGMGAPLPAGTPCMDQQHGIARGLAGGIALADIDGDKVLDVIAAAFDGNVYVWKGDGTDVAGFPVPVHYGGASAGLPPLDGDSRVGRIVTTPAVGDITGDGIPDIAVGSNQYLGTGGGFGAFFVIDGKGTKASGGPYVQGWPVVVNSFKLFPLVGEGIVSAGMMADVDGDGKLEVIFHGTGTVPVVLPAHPVSSSVIGGNFPNAVRLLDNQFGRLYESPQDLPGNNMIAVFSAPSVGDLDQDGHPDIVALGASFTLALSLQSSSKQDYEQQASFWSAQTAACSDPDYTAKGYPCSPMFPGSPAIIEDYTFFHNATVADVDGDDIPETLVGTGGYFVRAVNACGTEAAGFPKFTGQWIIPAPTVGDIDGDQQLELVTGTRDGWVYAWHTTGREDGAVEWPTYHHDIRNTGNYATPLDFPKRAKPAKALDLSTCSKAVVTPMGDAGTDGGSGVVAASVHGGGCGCSVPGQSERRDAAALGGVSLALAGAIARRRRTDKR